METIGFAAAMLRYFGKLPNQTNAQFLIEIKNLTTEDRHWFATQLKTKGFEVAA